MPTRPLVVVTGASGSGKTAVSAELHHRLRGHFVVDSDIFLSAAAHGYDHLFSILMYVAHAAAVGGRSTVLCGTLLPETFEAVGSRDAIGGIHYLNLDVADGVRRSRLEARPAWRQSSSEEFIARHLEFAADLRQRADMATLDTTGMSLATVADAVASWVREVAGDGAP